MPFVELNNLTPSEVIPGFRGRFVHSEHVTVAYWEIDAESVLPEHSHPHEQIAQVIEGEFELCVNGESRILTAGILAVIPGDALHSGRSLTQCRLIDLFYPIREDYR